jgi:hypothetical protein
LLGFGVHGLEQESPQPTLFDETDRDKQRKLDSVSDRIAERFGKSALRRDRTRRPAMTRDFG